MAGFAGIVRELELGFQALPRLGQSRVSSSACSKPCRMSPTWNMPWSMQRSSGFTVTDRAQKGDAKSGHRQIKRGFDDQNPGVDRRAGQSRSVFLLPGQRHDSVGVGNCSPRPGKVSPGRLADITNRTVSSTEARLALAVLTTERKAA